MIRLAESRPRRVVPVEPVGGEIVDREGELVAQEVHDPRLHLDELREDVEEREVEHRVRVLLRARQLVAVDVFTEELDEGQGVLDRLGVGDVMDASRGEAGSEDRRGSLALTARDGG